MLQQHLPFTVCAEGCETAEEQSDDEVRTSQVPEQSEGKTKVMKQQYLPFTVLKRVALWRYIQRVFCCNSTYRLQYWNKKVVSGKDLATSIELQQYLPFTVLKLCSMVLPTLLSFISCNSTYRLRYWNSKSTSEENCCFVLSCNNTYLLRYAPKGARQQRSKATMRSAHLKYLSEAKVKRR